MRESVPARSVEQDGKVYIGCMFYAERPGEQSDYPNVGSMSSTSEAFKEVYWRSILVFFASTRKTNPAVHLLLFSNARPPRPEWGRFLDSLDVEQVALDYASKPPSGNWHAWQSTFYILDVLSWMAPRMTPRDSLVLMDLDVVVVADLDPMIRVLRREGFLNLSIDYPADYPIHGFSRRDLGDLFREMRGAAAARAGSTSDANSGSVASSGANSSSAASSGANSSSAASSGANSSSAASSDAPPLFLGGEIYGFHGRSVVEVISRTASAAYRTSLERLGRGGRSFHTEEHLFSYVMWSLDLANNFAGPFIKRIWTSHQYRNVEPSDMNLLAWHVPAEKRRGLFRLSSRVLVPSSRFWRSDLPAFKAYVGRHLGIPGRTLVRWMRDLSTGIVKRGFQHKSGV